MLGTQTGQIELVAAQADAFLRYSLILAAYCCNQSEKFTIIFFEYARELRIVVLLREKEFYNRAEHEAHAKRHLPGTRERKSLEKNNVI